jgi:hypothetical protein
MINYATTGNLMAVKYTFESDGLEIFRFVRVKPIGKYKYTTAPPAN